MSYPLFRSPLVIFPFLSFPFTSPPSFSLPPSPPLQCRSFPPCSSFPFLPHFPSLGLIHPGAGIPTGIPHIPFHLDLVPILNPFAVSISEGGSSSRFVTFLLHPSVI